jgi:hypothetical protein
MKDAFVTAYNHVHAQDDNILLDFITTYFETPPDDEEYNDNSLLLETLGASGKYDLGILIGIADFACMFCPPDDRLSLGDNTLLKILVGKVVTITWVFVMERPFRNVNPVLPISNYTPFDNVDDALEKIFCTLLALSGVKGLEHAHDRSIIIVVEFNLEKMAFSS